MKYIKTKHADRIKELIDKGWCNYAAGDVRTVMLYGKYRGELGSHLACVNGLTDEEIQELRDYNYFSLQEQCEMIRAGLWGTPTLASNGTTYMR